MVFNACWKSYNGSTDHDLASGNVNTSNLVLVVWSWVNGLKLAAPPPRLRRKKAFTIYYRCIEFSGDLYPNSLLVFNDLRWELIVRICCNWLNCLPTKFKICRFQTTKNEHNLHRLNLNRILIWLCNSRKSNYRIWHFWNTLTSLPVSTCF